jgi:hypothetical protein
MKRAMTAARGGRLAVMVAFLASGAASVPALAQSTLSGQLASCLTIFGAVERLACYDRVARAAAGQTGVGAPGRQAIAPPPSAPVPVATPPIQAFGSEQLRSPRARTTQPDRLAADIAGINFSPFGKFTVTLSNGQVWRQLDSDDHTVSARKSMHSARIERGLLGSYNLQFNDSSLVYKVARVR